MTVDSILEKDLVGNEWLTEEELRFLMTVTDEETLQKIYKKALEEVDSTNPDAVLKAMRQVGDLSK